MSTKVEELLSLINECDMSKPYAFASYSKKDSEKVYQVVTELQKHGYNIWMDKELKKSVGVDWQKGALKAIAKPACKVILYFVSENSLVSAPVCAELCWSKSDKVKNNNNDEEMRIIPINVSECWDCKVPLSDWIKKVYESAMQEKLADDDLDVLRPVIDEKYTNKNSLDAYENHGEIARHIMNNIFIPQGGNKVTFVNYNDITTIMDNMKMTRVTDVVEVEEIVNVITAPEEVASNTKTVGENIGNIDVFTQNSGQNLIEDSAIQMEEGAASEVSSEKKKVFSLTGDVAYTLYGKEYIENQSDMMLRVFAQVLKRHQDKVDSLPEQDGMNCAQKYENIKLPGTSAAKPSYFRVCSNLEFDNGSAVCIGTAYSSNDKMKKIAKLLEICGESRSVFHSEQLELPEMVGSRAVSNVVEYRFYGQKYTGDQTEMMCHVCSEVIAKHPEKLSELVEKTLCIGYNDSSIEGKAYFRVSRLYQCGGREYKVGTSFGMAEKLKQIAKVFAICGVFGDVLQIEGYEFVVKEMKEKKTKTGKEKKNFFE